MKTNHRYNEYNCFIKSFIKSIEIIKQPFDI